MAEEKSTPAPKKEKAPKKEAAPASAESAAKAEATDRKPAKDKGPKGPATGEQSRPAGEKGAKKDAPAAEGAAPAAAPSDKPVELIGGVAKQPTAEDLLKEELGALKIRRAIEVGGAKTGDQAPRLVAARGFAEEEDDLDHAMGRHLDHGAQRARFCGEPDSGAHDQRSLFCAVRRSGHGAGH